MTVPKEAEGLIGSHYRAPDYFEVGREKIREFAMAIKDDHPAHFDESESKKAGYPDMVAPLTFLAIAGRRVQLEIFTKFSIPINIARVIHRDQKFKFHRPILAHDRLYFDTYLDSVIESHGTVLAEIRSDRRIHIRRKVRGVVNVWTAGTGKHTTETTGRRGSIALRQIERILQALA
jgi:acyl dehydratase